MQACREEELTGPERPLSRHSWSSLPPSYPATQRVQMTSSDWKASPTAGPLGALMCPGAPPSASVGTGKPEDQLLRLSPASSPGSQCHTSLKVLAWPSFQDGSRRQQLLCIYYRRAGSHVFPIAKQRWPFSHMEKIETLIYLFVLQRALAASLLCSPGTPSHTFESKINSFYLGMGSDGFLIWRKYRNNGQAGHQRGRKSRPAGTSGSCRHGAY